MGFWDKLFGRKKPVVSTTKALPAAKPATSASKKQDGKKTPTNVKQKSAAQKGGQKPKPAQTSAVPPPNKPKPMTQVKPTHVGAAQFGRYGGSGVCDVCNCSMGSGEGFLVPTNVFYASAKYREFIKNYPLAVAFGISVDEYIAHSKARDTTPYSAVCADCVKMFP